MHYKIEGNKISTPGQPVVATNNQKTTGEAITPGGVPPNSFSSRNNRYKILKNKAYDPNDTDDNRQYNMDAFLAKMQNDNIADFNYGTDTRRSALLLLSAIGCTTTDEYDRNYSTLSEASKPFTSKNPNLKSEKPVRPKGADSPASKNFPFKDDPFFKDTVPSDRRTDSGRDPGKDLLSSLASAYSTVFDAPTTSGTDSSSYAEEDPGLLTSPVIESTELSIAVESGAVDDEVEVLSPLTNVTTRRDTTVVANTQTTADTTTDMFSVGGYGSY